MIDSEFFTHIRSWVYMPFAGAFSLLTSFFLWLRVNDRRELMRGHDEIKEVLKANTAAIVELKVDVGEIKGEIKKASLNG